MSLDSERGVVDMLRLGELLHGHAFPTTSFGLPAQITPEVSERTKTEIDEIEKRMGERMGNKTNRRLRSIMGVRRDEIMNGIVLRLVAYASYHYLAVGSPSLCVTRLCRVVSMGDMDLLLTARHWVRNMIIKGDVLRHVDEEFGESAIELGNKLIKWLSGENKLEIVFDSGSIQKEVQDFQRKFGQSGRVQTTRARNAPARTPSPAPSEGEASLLTARDIYEAMMREVIALDNPLRRFACQMSLHMTRIEQYQRGEQPTVGPIVFALIGSSGSGKSWITSTFCRLAGGMAYSHADASCLSRSSYVGLSVEDIFTPLLTGKKTIDEAQKGLVVLDEIDKVSSKGSDRHGLSPQGHGIQSELLRPLEGCRIQLGGRRSNDPPIGVIDTSRTCFCLAGAFEGIREEFADMQRQATPIGFSAGIHQGPSEDIREALVRYGMMAQIVNRIGAVILLPDPTLEMMVQIITHPNGLLEKQNRFLGSIGLRMIVSSQAVMEIADWAVQSRGFARAAKTLLQTLPIVEECLFHGKRGELKIGVSDVREVLGRESATEFLG